METGRKRRRRNPDATHEEILSAARTILANDGIEGLSVSSVAQAAGVNRGTAYLHFQDREALVVETIASVSELLLQAVYGDMAELAEADVARVDQVALTDNLVNFAMENPDLCRVWLMQVLASADPTADPFWRMYVSSLRRFAATPLAKPGVDAEVLSVIVLAGTFLWPILSHVGDLTPEERRAAADRFATELLRLSMYGSMVAEQLPAVTRRLTKAD